MSHLEHWFCVAKAGSTVRRELSAGVVTYLALSYIIFVQPAVLSTAGMDEGGVLFATCVASAVGCFLMAALANYPIALAPAMGHNFFFAITVCGVMGFTWQQALAANLIAGVILLLIVPTGLRELVMHAIPDPVKYGLAAGIGLLIAMLGLQWGGLVVADAGTLIGLGDLHSPPALLTIFGLTVTSILLVWKAPAAILLGILGTAAAGWYATQEWGLSPALVEYRGVLATPPSPTAALQLDFNGLFGVEFEDLVVVIVTLLVLDLFDTAGSLIGVAHRAGFLVQGRLERASGAFAADAGATVVGASLGTSTVTAFVESAAGVSAGGRTGLTAVVVGILMLCSLFLTPLVEMVGAGVETESGTRLYPVIAPVLILVGVLMASALSSIHWDEMRDAIPAFLTVVMIPLSVSITDGIAWGMISYSLLALLTFRPAPLLVHILAAGFLLRYVYLP